MADQQFLASFGVDIDESGVSRLQKILTENRTLADSLAASFDAASENVKAYREQVATNLPALFSGSGYGRVTENLFGEYAGLKIGLNINYTYRFCGVTEIEYNFALNIDADLSQGGDYIRGVGEAIVKFFLCIRN